MDDGLFLNLASDGPVLKKQKKATSGSWKERHRANKLAKKRVDKENGVVPRAVQPKTNQAKVAKKSEKKDGQPRMRAVPGISRKNIADKDKNKKGEETFVSSLFSSNPEADATEENAEEVVAGAASNAPLKDSTKFEGLGCNSSLAKLLEEKMELSNPTRIQRAVLPRMISTEDDLFIQAETGSGKTLAYTLPIIERLMRCDFIGRNSGLFAVIIAPTRELSTQIFGELEKLVRCCHWIVPGIVIGGEKKKSEKSRIRKGINILVGTPGRLADHFDNTESLDLAQVRWVVMDEGDMLMELGFEETITKIMEKLEQKRQFLSKFTALPTRRVNVLCSATQKKNVKSLSEKTLSENSQKITPNSVDERTTDASTKLTHAPAQLIQSYVVVPAKLRLVTLAAHLKNLVSDPKARVMVFFSCSDSVDFHFDVFTREGFNPYATEDEEKAGTISNAPLLGENVVIHKLYGSMNQAQRTATLATFKKPPTTSAARGATVLFSTDLLSRGVDLPLITSVVEYDPPNESEEHLHRVGRTARAGAAGQSLIFLLPGKEEAYIDILKPLHPNGLQQQTFESLLKKTFGDKRWEIDGTTWHLDVERYVLADEEAAEKARNAFKSHIKSYATHQISERGIFNIKALHLGHIAKSFALRETPGSSTSTNSTTNKGPVREKNPRKRMLQMAAKHANSGADEFNIGY